MTPYNPYIYHPLLHTSLLHHLAPHSVRCIWVITEPGRGISLHLFCQSRQSTDCKDGLFLHTPPQGRGILMRSSAPRPAATPTSVPFRSGGLMMDCRILRQGMVTALVTAGFKLERALQNSLRTAQTGYTKDINNNAMSPGENKQAH